MARMDAAVTRLRSALDDVTRNRETLTPAREKTQRELDIIDEELASLDDEAAGLQEALDALASMAADAGTVESSAR